MEINEFINNLSASPLNNNFIRSNCNYCERDYFTHIECSSSSCGCNNNSPEFHELNNLTAPNIVNELSRFAINSIDMIEQKPLYVLNERRTPLFISAGVQIIDRVLHDEEAASTDTLVVAQPSVRLNFLGKTAVDRSFYTSFVNAAFVKADCDFESHILNTYRLFDFFESLGIDTAKLSLTFRESQNNWGDGTFNSIIIDILYRGITVGDSVLIQDYPQKTRSAITVSDISFGLERIIYAITGKVPENSIYNNINDSEYVSLDLLKTLTLIVGSAVFPSSTKNPGRKTRELIKILYKNSELDERLHVEDAINIYWYWWSQFTELSISAEDVTAIINEEKNNLGIRDSGNINRKSIRREKVDAIKKALYYKSI